ncbi:MAG: hypothetical protein AAFX95_20670 [Cyanobacteria bacterium J06639_16]
MTPEETALIPLSVYLQSRDAPDPHTLEFNWFHLVDGTYHDIEPNKPGHLWSQQLGLYLGVYNDQLRFFTSEGALVPTPEESAIRAESAVVEAQQQAETERQRAEALATKLRELGVDPADV